MGLNFALERKKFIEEQERLRKEYEAAGMTPEQIDEMYEHDLHRFNRDIAWHHLAAYFWASKEARLRAAWY